ncbi:single myb histone 4-like isoform X1 [Phoenix dactylifera]|uniref:Single myb histone 4-like isoform X1 n=1 Tax=Phoenix dactylifera TaxID=42345 RepID=A0A8B7CUT6_PHODC|nr:single myb histone 4-like isoform X1 [Phoenix dactylifera]
MGAPKQKWTPEEEEALRAGVDKHGAGKWRTIQKDPEFSHCLATRSNIDLKDKWRNMSIGACGHGSREQIRAPKVKGLPAIPSTNSRKLIVSAPQKDAGVRAMVNPTKNSHDGKNPPRYTAMISEALVAMQKQNGSEIGAICSFIEKKHEVPQNFRRLLSSKLRRLVAQNKIEKVQKGYRLKDSSFATKTLTLKQKDPANRSKLPQNFGSCISLNSIKDAAITAAYKIADAEAKSFLASEAVKEAEKISKMVEETDSLLLLAKEIFERCAGGEIMTMA